MAFNIITFSNSIVNLLNKNNVTTSSYDISSGLNERVRNVYLDYHINKPIPNILYPCIFVEPQRKSEDFSEIGMSARKREIETTHNIYAITDYGLGQIPGRSKGASEMLRLATNIEYLFRNFIHLSLPSDVLYSQLTDSEYDVSESNDTYNGISRITLITKILST